MYLRIESRNNGKLRLGSNSHTRSPEDSRSTIVQSPVKSTRASLKKQGTIWVSQTSPHLIVAGLQPHHFPTDNNSVSSLASSESESHDPINQSQTSNNAISQDTLPDIQDNTDSRATRKRPHAQFTDSLPASKRTRSARRDDSIPLESLPSISTPLRKRLTSRLSHLRRETSGDSVSAVPTESGSLSVASGRDERDLPASQDIESPTPAQSRQSSIPPSLPDSIRVTPNPETAALRETRQLEQASALDRDPNEITEDDLLPEFLPLPDTLPPRESFADEAAYILAKTYKPLPNPHNIIRSLTSHPLSSRSTATLYKLAENTQKILLAWQDEYIRLDARTAPAGNPPKKPATGGRVPVDKQTFERMKEIELWGHILGVEGNVSASEKKNVLGNGSARVAGPLSSEPTRTLRRRHADASIIDGLGISEDDAGAAGERKRTRRAPKRFDAGTNDKEKSSGSRKRNNAAVASDQTASDGRRKRGRLTEIMRDDDARTASPTPSEPAIETADDHLSHFDGKYLHREAAGAPAHLNPVDMAQHPAYHPQSHQPLNVNGMTERAYQDTHPVYPYQPTMHPHVPYAHRASYGYGANGQPLQATSNYGPPPAAYHAPPPDQHSMVPSYGPSVYNEKHTDESSPTASSGQPPPMLTDSNGLSHKKSRPKSEKRSESMTAWWAARKKKAAEEKFRELQTRGLSDGSTGSNGVMPEKGGMLVVDARAYVKRSRSRSDQKGTPSATSPGAVSPLHSGEGAPGHAHPPPPPPPPPHVRGGTVMDRISSAARVQANDHPHSMSSQQHPLPPSSAPAIPPGPQLLQQSIHSQASPSQPPPSSGASMMPWGYGPPHHHGNHYNALSSSQPARSYQYLSPNPYSQPSQPPAQTLPPPVDARVPAYMSSNAASHIPAPHAPVQPYRYQPPHTASASQLSPSVPHHQPQTSISQSPRLPPPSSLTQSPGPGHWNTVGHYVQRDSPRQPSLAQPMSAHHYPPRLHGSPPAHQQSHPLHAGPPPHPTHSPHPSFSGPSAHHVPPATATGIDITDGRDVRNGRIPAPHGNTPMSASLSSSSMLRKMPDPFSHPRSEEKDRRSAGYYYNGYAR